MTAGRIHKEADQPPADVYDTLAAAVPAVRAETLLHLIAGHPSGRLRLPALEGRHAVLNEVDLGRAALQVRQAAHGGAPPWWDAEQGAANLREAELSGAILRKAILRGAVLERADLEGADLAGADLRDAALGEARLQEALLEEADLQGASLRFADLSECVLEGANLEGADLWGANCANATLNNARLQGVTLAEANLAGADLSNADLREAHLGKANLGGARLRGADLQGATLSGANLRGAVLKDARLQGLVLTDCDITHIHLSGAWLEKTRFQQEQLGGALGEELAGQYAEARKGYLALERNFEDLGDTDAASWAYRKKRRMQKLAALLEARAAKRQGRWRAAVRLFGEYGVDQFVEWLCDYGESVPRVLGALLTLYLGFMVLYGVTGSVLRLEQTPEGVVPVLTRRPIDLAIFSLMAMTTSGSPAVGLQPSNELVHLLTGLQALLGIALTGLLGFVMGNRIRR